MMSSNEREETEELHRHGTATTCRVRIDGHQRDQPAPAPGEEQWPAVSRLPDEETADRASQLELVALP